MPTGEHPRDLKNPSIYKGKIQKYGSNFYIFLAGHGDGLSVIRIICLPLGPNNKVKRRWGIISGVSGVFTTPIAARILLTKFDPSTEPKPFLPKRVSPKDASISGDDLKRISNKLLDRDKEYILTVAADFL